MMNQGPQTDYDIWLLLKKFYVTSLQELTAFVLELQEENNPLRYEYPDAYDWVVEFEGMLRSNLWAEDHATIEDLEDANTAYLKGIGT